MMNRALKIASSALVATVAVFLPSSALAGETNITVIDAGHQASFSPTALPGMGGKSSNGHEVGINTQYLTLDGKPWLPVMGEFHYSRFPEQYWDEELLKMKAGGVQVVSTYVFWIHHEEIEGQFDWSGQRNLRRFVELCKDHGLYVFLRIGPYAHGEVRNGGLPDWVVARGATRRNDPQYLTSVRRYFEQVGQQVKGLFWKDGGPIIDIQLENEYSQRGPDAGAAHIRELKKMAREAGMVAPFYSVTGWDNAVYPPGEVMPVFGGYVDNFWDSSLTDLPPAGYYLFETLRAEVPAQEGETTSGISYPYFLAEAGGGMQVAYHRRPVISGDDIAAMTLTRLGSGANLYGYYMFQGGANPDGKRTSLQESVETDHVYDLPRVSYDFQAPLGQYGQMNPAFRATKPFHLFLNDFGSYLAPMATVLPRTTPADPGDRTTVRAAARIHGDHGFVFVNNYQRLYPLANHRDVQFQVILPSETLVLPRKPAGIPSGAYFIWPVNLDLGGVLLKYCTAQLLTMVREGNADYYFFFAQPGIPAEFAFDEGLVAAIHSARGAISRGGGRIYVEVAPGREIALTVQPKAGKKIHLILLSRQDAQDAWKLPAAGKEHLLLSAADVFFDDWKLCLRSRNAENLRFSIFPRLDDKISASAALRRSSSTALFTTYSANPVPAATAKVRWQKTRGAAPAVPPKMGKYNAVAPGDADFERAADWRISVPGISSAGVSDAFLRIDYWGDVGRLYLDGRLLDDDYFTGTIWEIGLKRFMPKVFERPLTLEVLPLHDNAPIYLPTDAKLSLRQSGGGAYVRSISLVPEYEVQIRLSNGRIGTQPHNSKRDIKGQNAIRTGR